MKPKRGNDEKMLESKGSALKKAARAAGGVLDPGEWTVGAIAWNREGNVVFLDPRVASFVRDHIRRDRELEIGIPDQPVEVGDGADGGAAAAPAVPVSTVKPPTPLTLCGCQVLRLHMGDEFPARTKLLSSEMLGGER